MRANEFKELWPEIQGKQVNIKYGKSTYRRKVLYNYSEALGTVWIKDGSWLATRAIKEIALDQVPAEPAAPVEVVEPAKVEVVNVAPVLPANWNEKGYFIITGKFGANWKRAELRDRAGEVIISRGAEMVSETSFRTVDCLHWIYEVKNRMKHSAPDYMLDDTYAAPQYFDISSPVIKQIV